MMLFFSLVANAITKDLENYLSNIQKQEFKIRYTNSKGKHMNGSLSWNKTSYPFKFIINLGAQKTTIINDHQKIIMHVEQKNSTDRIKAKDITSNPLASIFKAKVQFVEHTDSLVQTKSKKLGENRYQVILYKFTDEACEKEHLILEYEKHNQKVLLKKWITVAENRRITIDFL
ncbi:MAG: hypothetical protein H6850_03935 [Alphaproteobacteria bacterium]|nr:MAG: hypothetical protein H6850_03935 [Alphaproteobacteria bacterium]